jgi:thiosulfate reductase cytochrome b subunit
MVLETTIKISKELRNQLKEELHYGESYNDLIKLIYLGVKNAGFRCYED